MDEAGVGIAQLNARVLVSEGLANQSSHSAFAPVARMTLPHRSRSSCINCAIYCGVPPAGIMQKNHPIIPATAAAT